MNLRQRQWALVFTLSSALITACGSDAAKDKGIDTGASAGSTSDSAGTPGSDVGGSGSTNSNGGNHASGGAPSSGGANSGSRTGTVKLNLKVK